MLAQLGVETNGEGAATTATPATIDATAVEAENGKRKTDES